jgi:hypothetical protein
MKNTLTICILLFFITECSTTSVVIMPTQLDADRIAQRYPDHKLDDLHRGREIYIKNCGTCHDLKDPASETEMKWAQIVPVMVKKVNEKADSIVIDAPAEETLLRFLITMSSAPKEDQKNPGK